MKLSILCAASLIPQRAVFPWEARTGWGEAGGEMDAVMGDVILLRFFTCIEGLHETLVFHSVLTASDTRSRTTASVIFE